ncbi:MAG: hypothetical protein GTO45_25160, partial [Candidatus Aminicenantes bacterium]|nr:hypothetical protein [Candidatus Aminicenantes bacterium]NIM82029.1 hypothetical protein [Candidatus Aminicenantes bacterium]NIN21413.1 hypothetical protein [Candidatus Aminicenantes bacterium]NIN45240.1 hypothetical protein [Candidatus Aminicenantes bacterium]NIN88060.1 hypothetical protein [Candidatus Aminicenantes bacterium]
MSFNERKKIVYDIWNQQRRIFTTKLGETNNYTRVLYDLQNITNLPFDYAYQHNYIDLLDELAELYLLPLDHLKEMDEYWFFAGYDENKKRKYAKNSLGKPFKIWGRKTGDQVDEDV